MIQIPIQNESLTTVRGRKRGGTGRKEDRRVKRRRTGLNLDANEVLGHTNNVPNEISLVNVPTLVRDISIINNEEECLQQTNNVLNITTDVAIPQSNRNNRFRLAPIKVGESYPCGCGVCDKSYINTGNIVLCYGCKSMYINKSCNSRWFCASCIN